MKKHYDEVIVSTSSLPVMLRILGIEGGGYLKVPSVGPNAVGKTIRSLCNKKGISQDVLSGFAEIARTYLTMIENGDKQANFETLQKIVDVLDMRLGKLFALIENGIEQNG